MEKHFKIEKYMVCYGMNDEPLSIGTMDLPERYDSYEEARKAMVQKIKYSEKGTSYQIIECDRKDQVTFGKPSRISENEIRQNDLKKEWYKEFEKKLSEDGWLFIRQL